MSETIIFTKPGCPYCAAAKEDLQRRGIRYVERNAKEDPEALRQMLELNGGQRLVPTLIQGDQISVGFNGH